MDADKEIIAVDSVSLAIAASGNFKPDIKKNDKLPSWDGEIYVYLSKKKEKQGLYDVIPVQVKGTEKDSRVSGGFKYSVQIADLRNFLECRSGTTLFFVVFIHEEGEDIVCDIYYEKFLPFDLKNILKEHGEQDSVTMTFRFFPSKKKERARLLYDIVRDMKLQRSCIAADSLTLDSVVKEQKKTILTLGRTVLAGDLPLTPFSLLGQDHYFYVTRQDSLLQPIMHGRIDGVSVTLKKSIRVDGEIYYETCERCEYIDKQVLSIGNAIEFVFPKNDKSKMRLNVNLSWKLTEDIRDVSFLLALYEHKQLQLDDIDVPLDLQASSDCKFDVEMFRQHLDTCQMIQRLMVALDVTRDLDFSDLRGDQHEGLSRLYGFIIEGNRARVEFQSDYGIIEPVIGNLKILLFAIADKQNEHCYEIRSFSDIRNIVTTEDGNQTTPFVGLREEQIMNVDNINYENFFHQLENIPLSESHIKEVTHLFFRMLLAYDKSGDKRSDILNSAIQLAEWLEAHDQYSDQVYKTLNKTEAIKRSRKLNEQENDDLFVIAEQPELPPIYRSLAYVLLGEQRSAERFFKQVPADIQKIVREYPIFRFWQDTGC